MRGLISPLRIKWSFKTLAWQAPTLLFLAVGIYVLSIIMRVSFAQQAIFSKSELIPLSLDKPLADAPTPDSFGEKTIRTRYGDRTIVSWKQKRNGFQHMYGSALAAYELGDTGSNLLFIANEFAEWMCDWNSVSEWDLLDRKKDLSNNSLGRSIAVRVRHEGILYPGASAAILEKCVETMESDPQFIAHCFDPRVATLRESSYGCSWLPEKNLFNLAYRR